MDADNWLWWLVLGEGVLALVLLSGIEWVRRQMAGLSSIKADIDEIKRQRAAQTELMGEMRKDIRAMTPGPELAAMVTQGVAQMLLPVLSGRGDGVSVMTGGVRTADAQIFGAVAGGMISGGAGGNIEALQSQLEVQRLQVQLLEMQIRAAGHPPLPLPKEAP